MPISFFSWKLALLICAQESQDNRVSKLQAYATNCLLKPDIGQLGWIKYDTKCTLPLLALLTLTCSGILDTLQTVQEVRSDHKILMELWEASVRLDFTFATLHENDYIYSQNELLMVLVDGEQETDPELN